MNALCRHGPPELVHRDSPNRAAVVVGQLLKRCMLKSGLRGDQGIDACFIPARCNKAPKWLVFVVFHEYFWMRKSGLG